MHDTCDHKGDSNLSVRDGQYKIFGFPRRRRGRMFSP